MPDQYIKLTIVKLIVVFLVSTSSFSLYATELDTFNIRHYKIKNNQLKQCLSKIANEEKNKHPQIGLVVTYIHQSNEDYLIIGCHTLAWLKFYSMLYEVRDNDFVGCSYLKNGVCFFFGNEIKQYFYDSTYTVCIVDSNNYFKPLLGNEADFKEWFNGYCQDELYVDPPVWIFKKQKNKFMPIRNSEFHYIPKSRTHNQKFSAKERDTKTGYSYFGSRYYSSDLSIWLSVDPQSDKHPSLSPYVYCANNPIKLVDPNGEDIWELDDKGNILSHTRTKQYDKFIVNGKEKKFTYGTVEKSKTQTYSDDGKTTKSYDFYRIRGDDNGTELFEFLANETKVEWSQAKLGVEGEQGLNYITTSHDNRTEKGMRHLINGQLKYGYTAREFNHNHPGGTCYPSGSWDKEGMSTGTWGDLGFANSVNRIFGNNVIFNIYIAPNNTAKSQEQYINYDSRSKRSDYGKMFHPTTIEVVCPRLNYTPFFLYKYTFRDSMTYDCFLQMMLYLKDEIDSTVIEYLILSIEDEKDNYGVHSSHWSVTKDSELFTQYDYTKFVGFLLYGDIYIVLYGKEEIVKIFFDKTKETKRFYHIPSEFPPIGGFKKWNFEIINNLLKYDGMEYCE